MSYIPGPDLWDSDLSDDDYFSYSDKPKNINVPNEPKILTPEEKIAQQKNQLYFTICSGNVANVIQIIEDGVDVNINLQSNWTPLLLAVSTGNAPITEELIKRGAEPNSKRDGCTALMMACNCPKATSPFAKSLNVIKCLVENGANVKEINRKRMTALMFAANIGNLKAVEYLLPLSDKNAEDNQKWTALFWAVNSNEVEVSKYLLQNDLEYKISDVRGNTPLNIAKYNGFNQIIELFPKEEFDEVSDIISSSILSFDEIFAQTKIGEQPAFFLDVCNMLYGMKSDAMIKYFANKNMSLQRFLTISDDELKNLGIKMPFQRYRILAGLYKFHKHPYSTTSLHVVPLKEIYSNTDIGIQIVSAIKQLTVMEAGLNYVINNYNKDSISQEDLMIMKRHIGNIKQRIRICSRLTKKIREKSIIWDRQVYPADLITSTSSKFKWPWRKMVFTLTFLSVIVLFKFRK